jgi:hypothetical protein
MSDFIDYSAEILKHLVSKFGDSEIGGTRSEDLVE